MDSKIVEIFDFYFRQYLVTVLTDIPVITSAIIGGAARVMWTYEEPCMKSYRRGVFLGIFSGLFISTVCEVYDVSADSKVVLVLAAGFFSSDVIKIAEFILKAFIAKIRKVGL